MRVRGALGAELIDGNGLADVWGGRGARDRKGERAGEEEVVVRF